MVNVAGAAGRISLPSMSAFSVSNFGIEAFSDALRLEMQQFGVKVVVVEPGNYYGATGLQNRAAVSTSVQTYSGSCHGNEHSSLGNSHPQPFQLAHPLWTDPGVRELIST